MLSLEQTYDVERFVAVLAGDSFGTMTWRAFPEAPGAKGFPFICHGSFDEVEGRLCAAQAEGCGIFATVNRTDGRGGEAKNVVGCRAVWADFDHVDMLPAFPLEPSMVVQTKNGWHVYWVLAGDVAGDVCKGVNKGIAQKYGSDSRATDVARVLRVPGFMHLKGEPFLVRLLSDAGFRYEVADVLAAFPPIVAEEPATAFAAKGVGEDTPYGMGAATGEYVRLLETPRGKGVWNEALHKAAFRLGTLVGGGELSWGTAWSLVAKACNESGYADDHGHEQLYRVIESSMKAGMGRPRTAPAPEVRAAAEEGIQVGFYDRALAQLEKRIADGAKPIPGPLSGLNIALGGGLPCGGVSLLGAPPGQGKSSLALSWAFQAARAGTPVGFFSLELNEADLVSRAVTLLHRHSWIDVRYGKHVDDFRSVVKAMKELPFLAVARSECQDVTRIRDVANGLAQEHGRPPLLVVDYLQLLAMKVAEKDRFEAMIDVSESVRNAAVDSGAAILCITAVNRQSYDILSPKTGRPDHGLALQAAKLSGCLEYDAEVVMAVTLFPVMDGQRHGWICLAKNRSGGGSDDLPVRYDGKSGNFFDTSEDDVVASSVREDRKSGELEQKILNVIGGDGSFTSIDTLADAVLSSRSKVRDCLRSLLLSGRIKKNGRSGAFEIGD